MARKRLVMYVDSTAYERLSTLAAGDRRSMSERGAMILEDVLGRTDIAPSSGTAVMQQDARKVEQQRLGVAPTRADVDTRRTEPPDEPSLPDDPVLVTDPEFSQ